HLQIALLAALLHTLFWIEVASLLEDRVPTGRLVIAAVLIAAFGAGFWVQYRLRNSTSIHALRGRGAESRLPVTRKVAPVVESLLLDRLIPIKDLSGTDATDLIERAFHNYRMQDRIEGMLGKNRRQFNVVLIAADTLRWDEVGKQENGRSITPNIDRFSETSLKFERAYTPYPTSNYAYSSMLTGYYPRWSPAHFAKVGERPHPDDLALPEILRRAGWETSGITSFNRAGVQEGGAFAHTKIGFNVFNPLDNESELTAPEVTGSALAQIEKRDPRRPFLMWVHYMDPHLTYRPHDEFDFGRDSRDLYRGEIAYMDHHLGTLFDRLERADLRDNTIIIFFADHGEAFDEHFASEHNNSLFDEEIRVPMLVRIPGIEPRGLGVMGNLVDVTPTVLSLVGIQDPHERMGRDLTPLLLNLVTEAEWVDFSYSEIFPRRKPLGREMQRALIYQGLKLVRYAGDTSAQLFDLTLDPRENVDAFNPEDRRQQRLIGFMSALDLRFDGFMGAANAAKEQRARLIDQMDQVLARLENSRPDDDDVAVADYLRLAFGHDRRLLDGAAAIFDADRLRRARHAMMAMSFDEKRPTVFRAHLFTILTLLPDPDLEDYMRRCLAAPELIVARGAARWLALRGDVSGRQILLDSLENCSPTWGLFTAPALAKIGERQATDYLLAGLDRVHPQDVVESIVGLADLSYPELFIEVRERLSAGSIGVALPEAENASVAAAARSSSASATFTLLSHARSREASVARRARDELSQRLGRERQAGGLAMIEKANLGDNAGREGDWRLAASFYLDALRIGEEQGLEDPLIRIRAARCLALSQDGPAARRLLEPLLGPESSVAIRRYARSLDSAMEAGADLLQSVSSLRLRAEVAKPFEDQQLIGTMIARRVTLENTGTLPITGGAWFRGLRLVWYFQNTETGAFIRPNGDAHLIATFLPRDGIPPGESREFFVITQSPPYPGRYEPQLVITRRPWFEDDHTTLLKLPPIDIGR
ncbi:MAG: sulfatase, partial [Planctomycetes bacterium]|nr:sulfatase [Planctomycetota bacterium]